MSEFAGRRVQTWKPGQKISDVQNIAFKVGIEPDEGDWSEIFSGFLETPGVEKVQALVVGAWEDMVEGGVCDAVVEEIADAAAKLTKLEALFLADVTFEECEISWIVQTDMSPIFTAYPQLKVFGVRGGSELDLGDLEHENLEVLIVETGGLDESVVKQVGKSRLPKLRHLELWLGDGGYGASFELEDLRPFISGEKFPNLKYLGLRNSEEADAIAKLLAESPVLSRLEVLDLSLGTIGDEGGEALLASPEIKKLKKLNLRHNYFSEAVIKQFSALGIEVDTSENERSAKQDDRYVSVSE